MQLAAAGEVRKLLADYDKTLKEVNTWRTLYNQEDIQQLHARPMSDALVDLLKVDGGILGTVPADHGANGAARDYNEDQLEIGDDKWHMDDDMRNSNDVPVGFLAESASVAPARHIEADGFIESVPGSLNIASPGSIPSNFSQIEPVIHHNTVSATSFDRNSLGSPDDQLLAFFDSQNTLQHHILPANPSFTTLDIDYVPHTNVFLSSYQQDTQAVESINGNYLSYKTAPKPNFDTQGRDQLSLSYPTARSYAIENITT